MSSPLLSVTDLKIQFQTERGVLKAVDGLSFSLNAGETLCLVGESGCGKSVSALSLMRLLPTPPAKITSGKILFDGLDLLSLGLEELRAVRGSRVSMIFQEPMTSLNPVLSIGFQIAEAIEVHQPTETKAAIKKRVIELLEKVGIPDAENRYASYPHELSGGMRQRVMIAMALSCRPKLLIADEPTTALDVTIQAQILDLIRTLQAEMGMAVLLITHDLGIVSEMADRVIVMYAGRAVETAPEPLLFGEPLHPYTVGLLGSVPRFGTKGERTRLTGIPGSIPDLVNPPVGCRFEPRCLIRQGHCKEKDPLLEAKRPGRAVACWEVK